MADPKTPSEKFGDVEFEMDVASQWEDDLGARLGFKVARPISPSKARDGRAFEANSSRITGDVRVTPNVATKDVWNHEFRHLGVALVRANVREEDFVEKYGGDIAHLVYRQDERTVEQFDDPDAPAGFLRRIGYTIQEDPLSSETKEKVINAITEESRLILQDRFGVGKDE